MKKWIVFLLVATMIMTACGGEDNENNTDPVDPTATTVTTADDTATDENDTEEDTNSDETDTTTEDNNETDTTTEETSNVEPDILKVASVASVTTWDPIDSFSTEAFYLANIYEQLLIINPPQSAERFTPLLAERWDVSDDGLVWTFYLRPNVTFHDGEPLTAEAVKMSIEAAADRGGASFIWAPLDSINVVDDLTVELVMSYAAPVDLIVSSLYAAYIVSPKLLEEAAANENYFEGGVAAGTGPYRLSDYQTDESVTLVKNDDYWGGWDDADHFEEIQISIINDNATQKELFENGEVDLALRMPLESYAEFGGNDDYQLFFEPAFFNYVGLFNTLRPPLDDIKVRQALAYAIPYQRIIDEAVSGYGTQSRGPVPAGLWPHSPDVNQYTYDMEKARTLLAEAGYPDGGFSLRLTYANSNDIEAAFAPIIKESFAELGIDVTVEAMPFGDQWDEAKDDPANAQDLFLLLYWPTYSDAGTDNLAALFRSSEAPFFNLSYWVNEEFDSMVDEAALKTVTNPEEAQQLYTDAMNLLVEESPGLFFFDTQSVFVVPAHISNFEYNLNYPFATFFYPLHSNR
ncbi:MAG TPA: ABC transporter substrate-binding protein [Anaerolineae bacterium]|nr:ABC transporter substrate-binding protein [Anaerolineae bacterium]